MISDRLREDMKTAMKSGDKARLGVLRMLLSELKNARIDAGSDLDDAAEQKVLVSYAKKRRESMEAAREGGRDDVADREEFEHEVTMSYLPAQLSDEELRDIVRRHVEAVGGDAGGSNFGEVMKAVMAEVGSGADGKRVSAVVREMLS